MMDSAFRKTVGNVHIRAAAPVPSANHHRAPWDRKHRIGGVAAHLQTQNRPEGKPSPFEEKPLEDAKIAQN